MNTSRINLVGIFVSLAGLGSPARGAQTAVVGSWIATSAVAQASGETQTSPEDRVTELLLRARKAMAEDDLEMADSLLKRAESLKVRFGVLHLGDTPKKVRRDLARLQKPGPRAVRPSSQARPVDVNSALETSEDPGDMEQATEGNAASPPPAETPGSDPATTLSDQRGKALRYLAKGRAELERSNLAAAEHWAREAAKLGVEFAESDDSPATLIAEIRQAGGAAGSPRAARFDAAEPLAADEASPFGRQLPTAPPSADEDLDPAVRELTAGYEPAPLPASAPADPQVARAQSDQLLLEARRALAAGDVRQVQQALNQVRVLSVSYAPQDDSPDKVTAALRAAQQLAAAGEKSSTDATWRRRRAGSLMDQAEWLFRYHALDDAEQLAQAAAELRSDYGPFDATPSSLLDRITTARRSENQAARPGLPTVATTTDEPATHLAPTQGAGDALPQVAELVSQARKALAAGRVEDAERLATEADRWSLPDSAFGPQADRPALVLLDIARAKLAARRGTNRAIYNPAADPTRNVPAQALGEPGLEAANTAGDEAVFGEDDPGVAPRSVGQSPVPVEQSPAEPLVIDPAQSTPELSEPAPVPVTETIGTPVPTEPGSMLAGTTAEQKLLARQFQTEIIGVESNAKALLETDAAGALQMVRELSTRVENSGLDDPTRQTMLRHVARTLGEMEQFVEQNKSRLNLNSQNQAVRDDVERSRQMKIEIDGRLAKLVDEFNQLMDEQRYPEAELLAKRAEELDRDNPVVKQLKWQSRFVRRYQNALRLADDKDQAVIAALDSVDRSAVPVDDRVPLTFDAKRWDDFVKKRKGFKEGESPLRTEKDREIEAKLRTPVSVQFENRPLAEVIDHLAKLVQINIWLDPAGLAEEGVTTDQPVTINLLEEVQLRSALKVILEQLRLDYVIEDEMLKITSEQLRSGKVFSQTYYVADLVTPIPNFVPNSAIGLAGSIREGFSAAGFNQGIVGGTSPTTVLASHSGANNSAVINPDVMANVNAATGLAGASAGGPQTAGFGPGGLGGGAFADFDSLIELITSTVQPDSWDEVGGTGTIQEYRTNLSLVISQTQEVHEEIVELLEQLRRLQDLQVTIEVRFITLNDNFFERIGVDFDFDINDNIDKPFQIFGNPIGAGTAVNGVVPRNTQDRDLRRNEGVTVGLQPTGLFSTDLDIPARQGSFNLAVPQFGGFDPTAGVQMGFAILSDLEAFFLINAAQGDRRSNVLQAPKVTLFNGQLATVADVSQSPFVISVIPVVGDFAAAQQPVVVVLNEGTFLTVQAVVSEDRRYVRLTVVPFFSNIGEVNTFTFSGSSTTVENNSSSGPNDSTTARATNRTTTSEGTTVQLPTFSLVTVSTTVSVPDGGTVLLGGIKRLSEGRNEFGVPMLNKLPYINRLFKNVGIGRETQSLMMMVTPRIIIQEEEEEALLGAPISSP